MLWKWWKWENRNHKTFVDSATCAYFPTEQPKKLIYKAATCKYYATFKLYGCMMIMMIISAFTPLHINYRMLIVLIPIIMMMLSYNIIVIDNKKKVQQR